MSRGNGHSKAKRQQAILQLVVRESLGSQEEIRSRLAYLGIEATQSTISRDIEELGLARVHSVEGVRYVAQGEPGSHGPIALLRHLLDEFALSFVRADAGLLIRTSPGAAAGPGEGRGRPRGAPAGGPSPGATTLQGHARAGVGAGPVGLLAGGASRRGRHHRRRQHHPRPWP